MTARASDGVGDDVVLRLVGVVPVPGGDAAAGQDDADRCSPRSTRRCALLGGVPTYVLTDNEKTVTVEHVAGIAVRNRQMVAFARHYGLTVATCVPADPASQGRLGDAVQVAKADLVPTRRQPAAATTAASPSWRRRARRSAEQVNARPHRVTRRAPAEMLAEEQARLHRLPRAPFTAAFGVTRTVAANTPMVNFEHGQYSVPHPLVGETVWVRRHGASRS